MGDASDSSNILFIKYEMKISLWRPTPRLNSHVNIEREMFVYWMDWLIASQKGPWRLHSICQDQNYMQSTI
jgi:hypothetical protein